MGTVATSTLATATAFGNQRKVDRASNGVLWSLTATTGALRLEYSTDAGVTWADGGPVGATTSNFTPNGSIKFDEDDFLHVAYKDPVDGYIKYMRGTLNAARTACTLSAAVTAYEGTNGNYPDIVAHRDSATAGAWVAHIVYSFNNGSIGILCYNRVSIAANGATTLWKGATQDASNSASYSNGNHVYPSIDFNHTGDGKTVAGSTPHLYVGWSAGATGSGYGIRFRKATYSAGSWTWGTEREIDNTHAQFFAVNWLSCAFDGTRVVIAGYLPTSSGGGAAHDLVIHDRDAADTTTTNRTLLVGSGTSATALQSGGFTFDATGNLYLFGRSGNGSSGSYSFASQLWTRATQALGTRQVIDASANDAPYGSVRRGPQGQAIDYVYTDGTASPYEVKSGRIVLNQNPTAPTPVSPADNATFDSSADLAVVATYSDPDGDAASGYRLYFRPAGTSVAYQLISGSSSVASGSNQTVTVPANTWPGQIAYYWQFLDASGALSAPSAVRTITGTPAALSGATGGSGGTAFTALTLYNATEVDRVQRVVTRAVLTTVAATSPLTITIDGGPVTALRNAGYTPTAGDQVQAEYTSGQWVVVDKVVS